MKKRNQFLILILFVIISLLIIFPLFLFKIVPLPNNISGIALWVSFGFFWLMMINEGYMWVKNGKRSDWFDLIAIAFVGLGIYILTAELSADGVGDALTALMGAFSIYLIFGIYEVKDYEIINKILIISTITYNIVFISGLLDLILKTDENIIRDTAFNLSFWIMLALGFIFFGRKYLSVFRFMSPTYLTMALYLIAWGVIASLSALNDNLYGSLREYIYEIIIATNVIIYIFSGPLLDKMMGYKETKDERIVKIVHEVALKMGMNPHSIKIRFAQYPILNAMAYGAFFNKHMAIISPSIDSIPEDELKGIIAHEFSHLRGLHTLWLTIISSLEILIFKLLGWPATTYDYTFAPDDQPFSMGIYLLISFSITILIYFLVRDFEAHADKGAKKAGYGKELAKGLYNLESFYATSHEIGLDATLLSNEKETEENKMLNFFSTANYLNKNLINPSKGTLLSNLMNSHPPSYHRIMTSLHYKDISCRRIAFMPLTFLKKKRANKFLLETLKAREEYLKMVTDKVKERFNITDIRDIMEKLNRIDNIKYKIGNTYIFYNFITKEKLFGKINDIFFVDDVSEPTRYKISIIKGKNTGEIIDLNPYIHKEIQVSLNEEYYFKKHGILTLKAIDMDKVFYESKQKKKKTSKKYLEKNTGIYIFESNKGNKEISKPIFNTKLPRTFQHIETFKNKDIFVKEKGNYKRLILSDISYPDEKLNFTLKTQDPESNNVVELKKEDYVIKFSHLYFPIYNDEHSNESQKKFLMYIKNSKIRCYVLLKKAVNSEFDGFIEEIIEKNDEKLNIVKFDEIKIKSMFDESITLKVSSIDSILIDKPLLILVKKDNISTFSNMINQIRGKRHPEKIFN